MQIPLYGGWGGACSKYIIDANYYYPVWYGLVLPLKKQGLLQTGKKDNPLEKRGKDLPFITCLPHGRRRLISSLQQPSEVGVNLFFIIKASSGVEKSEIVFWSSAIHFRINFQGLSTPLQKNITRHWEAFKKFYRFTSYVVSNQIIIDIVFHLQISNT